MMKKAKIKPLLKKKEDRQDIKKYRPISILLVFYKPLEKLIHNELNFRVMVPCISDDNNE
jgi:hypothetical protein